jgi:perosamine synthetase
MNFFKPLICAENGPNFQLDDSLVALRSIFQLPGIPNRTASGLKSAVSQKLLNYLGLETNQNQLYFTDTGRTGLTLALKALNLEVGSEVAIQAFSCVVVPNSLLQAGLEPLVVDIDPQNLNLDLEDLAKKITPQTKAVIVQYNFGLAPDMTQVLNFCKARNLYLIEDMAHGLGVELNLNGKKMMAGTVGDAAVFSFGRDKIISTTSGGAVWVNPDNSDIISRFNQIYEDLPPMPNGRVLQNLIYTILFPTVIRPLYHLGIGKLVLVLAKKLKLIGPVYTMAEKHGSNKFSGAKYSPQLFWLLQNQLRKLDQFNQHRRRIAQIYAIGFGLQCDPQNVYLRFPLKLDQLAQGPELQAILLKLKPLGFVLGANWYDAPFLPKTADLCLFNYIYGSCPVAEKLSQNRILNLPTNIWVIPSQAKGLVKNIYSKI